jgi:hypothetical protein
MRRRLGACHADSNEEYLQKLKAIDSFDSKVKTNPTAQMSPYNVSCTLEALTGTPIFGSDNSHSLLQSPLQREEEKTPSDFYESFTFNSRPDESSQGLSASEEAFISLEQLAVKTIIVGSKEVQRHAFVHALVPGEAEETATKSSLDLVVKVKSEEKRVLKYHFWIKDCDIDQEEVEKFKGIYKVYYNFVSSLIFMYSVSDHESFNLLKKSIEEIKKSVGIEGFKAILIGLVETDSQNTRQISYQEGENLMQEEGFAAFIEADLNDVATKEKALGFLCDRAEVQAKRKKSNINLN